MKKKPVNGGNNNHVSKSIYYIYSFLKPKNIRNLFVNVILLLIIFNHNFFLFKTTKKLKQWRLQLSSLFKENTKKSRLINMMKFPAELRKSDGILIKRVAVAWKEIPEKKILYTNPSPPSNIKKDELSSANEGNPEFLNKLFS